MKPLHFDQINPQTGTLFRWDDPNLRFVDGIGMFLEPGDPGFVPYAAAPPVSTETPKTKKRMAKTDYIKNNDAEFSAQLTAFKNAIGAYTATFGLTPLQISTQANDADYFAYVVACQDIAVKSGQQYTGWRDILRDGGAPPASGVPMAPVFPAAVAAVAPGVEARFRALVKLIKAHGSYNPPIGEVLGIEGPSLSGPDFATFKPVLTLEPQGGQVLVRWNWQGYRGFLDAIEICVDRGDGEGFQLLTIDTTPGYTDTAPFPAAAARWSYKAIFRVGDQRVGQWSDVTTIAVG
jgi:hypothetical protein